jgi:23S rRNA-/tRNA-specific pseudouridylate synthase
MDLPLHPDCTLLKRDPSGLVAVNKACGVLSHPNSSSAASPSAMITCPYNFDEEAYTAPDGTWYLLNRLDGPTSGVILLAESAELAESVKAAFAAHTVEKTYAALVKGIPPRKRDAWRDCLVVKKRGGTLRTEVAGGKPNAFVDVELLQRGAGPPARALISLKPSTGRTHQLRVQCASRRLPIIGDATYGDFGFNREFKRRTGESRLFLHSWKTRVAVNFKGQAIDFSAEAPLPDAFTVALR